MTHVLVLGAALAGLLGCNGSPLHADGATDLPTNDGALCRGEPVSCVQGTPSGTGVACNSTFVSATCVGGQWTCPKGTVDERGCTCGEPGLSCSPQICTEHGAVCLDAGVDANADAGCAADTRTTCVQGTVLGDYAACADVVTDATCVGGQWTCPVGSIDPSLCRCDGVPAPGCSCTEQGFSCPDGGADAPVDAGGTCTLSTTYTFYDDGGLRAFVDHSTLAPPRTSRIQRDTLACQHELPCASPTAVTVPSIEAAVANADVQAALAKPAGMLYGGDPRPVDGTVFSFARGDGRGFLVGSGTVPAGLRALEMLLHGLYAETLASTDCLALSPK